MEYPSQSNEIKRKTINTFIEKYGVENPLQSEEIKERIKKTNLEKYGAYNYNSSNYAKNKRIELKQQVPDHQKKEFELYTKIVRNKTNCVKKQLFENWDGADYYDHEVIIEYLKLEPYNKKYPTIDHKLSIYYGFINNINPEIIGDLNNLCITKRSINSIKGIKCL